MKALMNAHVEGERHTMFERSTAEVRERLTALVRSVEETMLNKADEVFMQIRRDYLAVLGGTEAPAGQFMPKWQRTMREEVTEVISGCEKLFKKIAGIEDEEDQEDHDEGHEEDVLKGHVPEDDVKQQDEDASTKVEQDVKIKPEKEDENHDNDAFGLRGPTKAGIPSVEQHEEPHDTQDVVMEDPPAIEYAAPTNASDDGLAAIETANEVSKSTDITENTVPEEKTQTPLDEPPTPADSTKEQPNPLLLAGESAANANTSTDDSDVHHESDSPEHRQLPPTPELANQQLENESRGIGHGFMLRDNQADNSSDGASVDDRSYGSGEDDSEG